MSSLAAATSWRAAPCTQVRHNMPNDGPVLYLPLPGVQQDVVIAVPREVRFAWPEELRRM